MSEPLRSCRSCRHRVVCVLRTSIQSVLAGNRNFLGAQVTPEEDAIYEALGGACQIFLQMPEEEPR